MTASVRRAGPDDALALGRLLHDFNTEFEEPCPPQEEIAERLAELLAAGDETIALLAGDGPDGLALLRLRPSVWSRAQEAYLAELYVVPDRRGHGLGRALLEAAMAHAREAGADHIDLATGETDTAARALYASLGFTNREGGPDGPLMLVYERDL